MRRVAFSAAFVLALSAAAGAAEPSLSVKGAPTPAAASQARSLANQALGLAAGGGAGSGPALHLDPSRAANAMPGFGALNPADQNLALAGGKVFEMMRALGGASDRGAVLQRQDNMVYVGIDGEGGRWFASAGQALSFMTQSMIARSPKLNYRTKQRAGASGCAEDILCAILAVAQDPYFTVATLTRGNTATVEIAGKGFSNSGGGPSLASGDGILVQSVSYQSAERIAATLHVAPTAKLGEHLLAVYNAGQGFQNAGVYRLIVADGAGAAPVTQSSSRAAAQMLALQTAAAGLLAGDGQEQFWRIDATAPGTLTVASTGGADVKATLEDAQGLALAGDDDAGGWYNFKLTRSVAAGSYYLRVGHCCGGAGAYRLTATLTP